MSEVNKIIYDKQNYYLIKGNSLTANGKTFVAIPALIHIRANVPFTGHYVQSDGVDGTSGTHVLLKDDDLTCTGVSNTEYHFQGSGFLTNTQRADTIEWGIIPKSQATVRSWVGDY